MILSSYAHAIGQLRDPQFRRVIWFGVALAVALLFAMYALVLLAVQIFVPGTLTLPLAGEVSGLQTLLSIGSLLVMLGLSVFLMVPVASAFTGLFLEDVANAVELKYYPGLPAPTPVPLATALTDSLRYFGLLVALNLLGMVVFVFSGGLGFVVFWGINAWLLAREYFTMVALRRHPAAEARALQQRHRWRLWFAGMWLAVPLSIPILNLLMPVVGAAAFTHMYHRVQGRKPGSSATEHL
ncbi:EI24 domain-containing protein [Roseibaca calidilacus]|uniref:EI24 domain-containing protein n=1 Tax=Roseibaca calidilacus TaxID=1666912 RepID=UPI000AF7B22B|nr:EI24 domain-containing protein [Roseibaca calidilacus]